MGLHGTLTADQVAAIRTRAKAGESKTTLATEYGVGRATLYASLPGIRCTRKQ